MRAIQNDYVKNCGDLSSMHGLNTGHKRIECKR